MRGPGPCLAHPARRVGLVQCPWTFIKYMMADPEAVAAAIRAMRWAVPEVVLMASRTVFPISLQIVSFHMVTSFLIHKRAHVITMRSGQSSWVSFRKKSPVHWRVTWTF